MNEIITFSERHTHYGVSFIDIIGSSLIVSHLSGRESDIMYATFLNTCARVIKEHGGEVVKNVGDGLLYYFPDTDFGSLADFENVLNCAFALTECREEINSILKRENLPSISFRISASYGPVSVAEGEHNSVEDLFGVTINTCAKINRYAEENGIIIGSSLYGKVKNSDLFICDFVTQFEINDKLTVSLYGVIKNTKK